MKRQVIQNVLNLPGISGMALIDGRNRPFFFGPDISLNTQQQDALAQGIQQVVSTTPDHFETFGFRFTNQLTHIYKLDQGLILLVLVTDQLALKDYRMAIGQLKATLMEAPHNAVPTFRLLAGCVTLGNGAIPPDADPPGTATAAAAAPSPDISSPTPGPSPPTASGAALSGAGPAKAGCQEVVEALNHLSDGAVQYLGKIIVANTWKQSRPAQPWLDQFVIGKDGDFTVGPQSYKPLTPEQHQWIRDWVAAFLTRGGRTIRNFPTLVSQTLSPPEQELLLGHTSNQKG
jgi:hypothetical protein